MGYETGAIKLFFRYLWNDYTRLYFAGSGIVTGGRVAHALTVAATSLPDGLWAISVFVARTLGQTLIPVIGLTISSMDAFVASVASALLIVFANIVAGGAYWAIKWYLSQTGGL